MTESSGIEGVFTDTLLMRWMGILRTDTIPPGREQIVSGEREFDMCTMLRVYRSGTDIRSSGIVLSMHSMMSIEEKKLIFKKNHDCLIKISLRELSIFQKVNLKFLLKCRLFDIFLLNSV